MQTEGRPQKTFESVLCIPGNWKNRDEFLLSMVSSSNGEYLFAGNLLMNVKANRQYTIDFCERDDRMKMSFKYAGMVNGVSENFLNEIENHKHVVYVIGTTGSFEHAQNIAEAGSAVLRAGGLGIKIETAGKAFEKKQWTAFVEDFKIANLYMMFVVDSISNNLGTVYSCGMQNLGLKDTIVSGVDFQEAVKLISIFSYYQIIDKPNIQNHQTFSIDQNAPKFMIVNELNQPYKSDELFENPFGMWRLCKV